MNTFISINSLSRKGAEIVLTVEITPNLCLTARCLYGLRLPQPRQRDGEKEVIYTRANLVDATQALALDP